MKYAIDKIEDNIITLENLDNKEIIILDKSILPNDIHEGTILKYIDGNYILDTEFEEDRRKKIEAKFRNLRSQ